MRTPRYLVAALLVAGGLAACSDDKTAPDPCIISGVTMASVPTQMTVGQTATVQATVQQQGCSSVPAVAYSSTDAAVVSVSSAGVVTAVAVGQATITAQLQGRSEPSAAAPR